MEYKIYSRNKEEREAKAKAQNKQHTCVCVRVRVDDVNKKETDAAPRWTQLHSRPNHWQEDALSPIATPSAGTVGFSLEQDIVLRPLSSPRHDGSI